jgi:hypothetical protein
LPADRHAVAFIDARQSSRVKLPNELTEFLAKPRIAVLATAGRNGAPATTACWYDLEDGKVLITMYANARRLKAIIDDPRVAMTIVGDDPYQHVSLAGRVEKRWADPELRVMDRLSMRYTGEPWQERKPCVSALIETDRWHTYGLLSEASDYSSSTH